MEILIDRAEFAPGHTVPLFTLRPPVFEGVDYAVKRTFDLRYQTQQHPWLMVGGSVMAGFTAGKLLGRWTTGEAEANGRSYAASASPS